MPKIYSARVILKTLKRAVQINKKYDLSEKLDLTAERDRGILELYLARELARLDVREDGHREVLFSHDQPQMSALEEAILNMSYDGEQRDADRIKRQGENSVAIEIVRRVGEDASAFEETNFKPDDHNHLLKISFAIDHLVADNTWESRGIFSSGARSFSLKGEDAARWGVEWRPLMIRT